MNEPVTEAELARVLELDAKATKGPWQCEGNVIFRLDEGAIVADLHEIDGATGFGLNDELITEYRTLTPRLARELAAARAAIKVAREALRRCQDVMPETYTCTLGDVANALAVISGAEKTGERKQLDLYRAIFKWLEENWEMNNQQRNCLAEGLSGFLSKALQLNTHTHE